MSSNSNYRGSSLGRRLLSFIMALALCLGLLPAMNLTARAVEQTTFGIVDLPEGATWEWVGDAATGGREDRKDIEAVITGLDPTKEYKLQIIANRSLVVTDVAWGAGDGWGPCNINKLSLSDSQTDTLVGGEFDKNSADGLTTVTYRIKPGRETADLSYTVRLRPDGLVIRGGMTITDALTFSLTYNDGGVEAPVTSKSMTIKYGGRGTHVNASLSGVPGGNAQIRTDAYSALTAMPEGTYHWKIIVPQGVISSVGDISPTASDSTMVAKNFTATDANPGADKHGPWTIEWDVEDNRRMMFTVDVQTYDITGTAGWVLQDDEVTYLNTSMSLKVTQELKYFDNAPNTLIDRVDREMRLTLKDNSIRASLIRKTIGPDLSMPSTIPQVVYATRFITNNELTKNQIIRYKFTDNRIKVTGVQFPVNSGTVRVTGIRTDRDSELRDVDFSVDGEWCVFVPLATLQEEGIVSGSATRILEIRADCGTFPENYDSKNSSSRWTLIWGTFVSPGAVSTGDEFTMEAWTGDTDRQDQRLFTLVSVIGDTTKDKYGGIAAGLGSQGNKQVIGIGETVSLYTTAYGYNQSDAPVNVIYNPTLYVVVPFGMQYDDSNLKFTGQQYNKQEQSWETVDLTDRVERIPLDITGQDESESAVLPHEAYAYYVDKTVLSSSSFKVPSGYLWSNFRVEGLNFTRTAQANGDVDMSHFVSWGSFRKNQLSNTEGDTTYALASRFEQRKTDRWDLDGDGDRSEHKTAMSASIFQRPPYYGATINGYLNMSANDYSGAAYNPGKDGTSVVNAVSLASGTSAWYHMSLANTLSERKEGRVDNIVMYVGLPSAELNADNNGYTPKNTVNITDFSVDSNKCYQFDDYKWPLSPTGNIKFVNRETGTTVDTSGLKVYAYTAAQLTSLGAHHEPTGVGTELHDNDAIPAGTVMIGAKWDDVPPATNYEIVFEVKNTTDSDIAENAGLNGAMNIFRPNAKASYTISGQEVGEWSSNTMWSAARLSVGSVRGTAFLDSNGNGLRDTGEDVMPGVKVSISKVGDDTWSYAGGDQTTSPIGAYEFKGLDGPATYMLTFENPDPAEYRFTQTMRETSENYTINSDVTAVLENSTGRYPTATYNLQLPYKYSFKNGQSYINAGFIKQISIKIANSDSTNNTYGTIDATALATDKVVWPGEKLTEPTKTEVNGRPFDFWDYDGTVFDFSNDCVYSSGTITAHWKHKVTFMDADGSTQIGETNYVANTDTVVRVPTPPEKAGKVFVGWKDGDKIYSPDAVKDIEISGDTKFVALYANDGVATVVFNYDGGVVGDKKSESFSGEPGKAFTTPKPTRKGWTLEGWSDPVTTGTVNAVDGESTTSKFGTAGTVTTFTAKWTGGVLTVSTVGSVVYTGEGQTPALSVKVGEDELGPEEYVAQYGDATNNNIDVKEAVPVKVVVAGGSEYAGMAGETTFAITKADQTVTFAIPTPSAIKYSDGASFSNAASAKLDGEHATVSYTVDNESVATVDGSGNLTIKKAGDVTVTAVAEKTDNVNRGSASYSLTIDKAEPKLTFASSTVTARTTDSAAAANPLTKAPANLDPVSYTSSNPEVAEVNPTSGAVTLKNKAGTATITARFDGNDNYKAAEASYTLSVESHTIQFTASDYNGVYDAAEHGITVTPSDPADAVVSYAESADGSYSDTPITLTEVGTKTVYFKITAPGYDEAAGSASITITPAPLYLLSGIEARTYTGEEVKQPNLKVIARDINLKPEEGADKDYTVTYVNNVNASAPKNEKTAAVIVTGQGNYTGTLIEYYTINPKSLDGATVEVNDAVYDGTPQEPKPVVKDADGKILTEGVDYELEWDNNVQPGESAKVTVKGKGNYDGTTSKPFTIKQEGDLTLQVMVDNTKMIYDGQEWKPAVLVTAGTTALKEGTDYDYTVTYGNNTNASSDTVTGVVTVIPRGNYSYYDQPDPVTFRIEKAEQSITASDLEATYGDETLAPQEPTISRTAAEGTRRAGADIDDGSAKTVTYVSGNPDVVVWSEDAKAFKIMKAGEATVTATVAEGANFKAASTTFKVTVNPKNATFIIDPIADQQYTGSELTPKVVVKDGDKELVEGKDYTLTYENNTDIGTGKVTATGMGDYAPDSTGEGTFNIVAPTAALEIADIAPQTYTGDEIKPEVTVTFPGSGTLTPGEDYDVTYENNEEAGTATVTVTGKPGTPYEGVTVTKTFEIEPKSIDGVDTDTTATTTFTKTYDGSPIIPSDFTADTVEVKSEGKTLTLGTDYVVKAILNASKDVGKYAVEIEGKKNYIGSLVIEKEKGAEITPVETELSAALSPATAIYDGSEQSTTVTVTLPDGTVLTPETDYTLSIVTDKSVEGAPTTFNGSVYTATEIGTYTIHVEGTGNYSDELNEDLVFTIEGSHNLIATIEPNRVTYTGAEQEATVTVKAGGDKTGAAVTLEYGKDYTIDLVKTRAGTEGVRDDGKVYATNAGTYDITVKGAGNYADRNEPVLTFVVDPKVTTFTVTLTDAEYTYDGTKKETTVKVEDDGNELTEGTDYEIVTDQSKTEAIEAGTYTVLVKGIGNYAGSTGTAQWVIKPLAVASPLMVAMTPDEDDKPNYEEADYDGQNHVPTDIVVKSGEGEELPEGDYALTYTFTDNEGHTTDPKPFDPETADFTEAGVYTIYARTNDNVAEEGDGNGMTPYGTAVVFVKPTDISTPEDGEPNFTVTPEEGPYYYTGEAVTPTGVTVTDKDSNPLEEGKDYDLVYDNNTDAGTATVTAVGKGNYSGAVSNSFEILPMPVIAVPVDASKVFTQVDSQSAPVFGTLKVTDTQNAEIELKDAALSNLSREAGEDVGKYAYVLDGIAITGEKAGNYALDLEGSKQAYEENQTWFTITPKAINSEDVTFDPATFEKLTYNGEEQAPAFTLTDKYSKPEAGAAEQNEAAYELVQDTDFTVSYKDAEGNALESAPTKAGTYTLVVTAVNDGTETATGNYTGSIEKEFTIEKATLTEVTVTVTPASETYTGKVKTPTVTVEGKDADGNTIPMDADNYDIVWKDSKGNEIDPETALKDVGKYTVTATAKEDAPDVNATHEVTVTNDDGTTTTTEPLSGTGDYQIKKKSNNDGGPSGGSSTKSYTVNVSPTKGGTVTSSKDRAAAGVTVTLTVKPEEGNTVANLAVTDENKKAVAIKNAGNGTYTFTMPASDVTVTSSFLKAQASADDTGVSRYLDTKNHVAYFLGMPDGTIAPEKNITRAETAMIFYRLLLNKNVTLTVSFEDVASDAWYATAVRTLASMGMFKGIGDGEFAPERTITRAEFAAVATRFANAATSGVSFNDVPDGYWAKDNIITAATYGWINGDGNGNFRPAASITRGETATIVNHMLNRAADKEYVSTHTSELAQFSDLQDSTRWYYLDLVEAANSHDYTIVNGEESWSKINK